MKTTMYPPCPPSGTPGAPAWRWRAAQNIGLTISLTMGLSGCGLPTAGPFEPGGATAALLAQPVDQRAALQRIMALIADAPCRHDADCHTLGIGHKACGGPARYLAWSSHHTSGTALADAVAQWRAAEAPGEGPGRASNCQMVVDPGASCRAAAQEDGQSRCVLRQPGSAGFN